MPWRHRFKCKTFKRVLAKCPRCAISDYNGFHVPLIAVLSPTQTTMLLLCFLLGNAVEVPRGDDCCGGTPHELSVLRIFRSRSTMYLIVTPLRTLMMLHPKVRLFFTRRSVFIQVICKLEAAPSLISSCVSNSDVFLPKVFTHRTQPTSLCFRPQKISGGRKAQHASTGDLLIFRGQQPNAPTDRRAVAHRSPDMSKGHRRLVLTIDISDITT